jgi:hypothetical protein
LRFRSMFPRARSGGTGKGGPIVDPNRGGAGTLFDPQEMPDRGALCFEAEAAVALFPSADPVVGHVSCAHVITLADWPIYVNSTRRTKWAKARYFFSILRAQPFWPPRIAGRRSTSPSCPSGRGRGDQGAWGEDTRCGNACSRCAKSRCVTLVTCDATLLGSILVLYALSNNSTHMCTIYPIYTTPSCFRRKIRHKRHTQTKPLIRFAFPCDARMRHISDMRHGLLRSISTTYLIS